MEGLSAEAREIIELISKLSDKQKELVLATIRGAVLISEVKDDDAR